MRVKYLQFQTQCAQTVGPYLELCPQWSDTFRRRRLGDFSHTLNLQTRNSRISCENIFVCLINWAPSQINQGCTEKARCLIWKSNRLCSISNHHKYKITNDPQPIQSTLFDIFCTVYLRCSYSLQFEKIWIVVSFHDKVCMREQIIEQILSFVNLVLLPCTDGLVDQCYIPSYPMCTKVFVNSVSSWLTFYKYEKHSRKICQCHGCLCSFGHFDQKAKSCVCNVHIHNITFKYTIQLINLTMIMTSQMSNQNFSMQVKIH